MKINFAELMGPIYSFDTTLAECFAAFTTTLQMVARLAEWWRWGGMVVGWFVRGLSWTQHGLNLLASFARLVVLQSVSLFPKQQSSSRKSVVNANPSLNWLVAAEVGFLTLVDLCVCGDPTTGCYHHNSRIGPVDS